MSNGRLAAGASPARSLLWLAFVARVDLAVRGRSASGWRSAVLAVVHARLLQRIERARGAERVYQRGLERLSGEWAGTGRDGARFLDGHPYARDLDLFGRARSSSCSTPRGPRAARRRSPSGSRGRGRARRGARPPGGRRRAEAEARFPRGPRRAGRRNRRSAAPALLAAWAASPPAGFRPALAHRARRAAALVTIALAVAGVLRGSSDRMAVRLAARRSRVAPIWRPRDSITSSHAIDTPEHDLGLLAGAARARSSSSRSRRRAWRRCSSALVTDGVPPSQADRAAPAAGVVARLDAQPALRADRLRRCCCGRSSRSAIDRWHGAYGPAVGGLAAGRRRARSAVGARDVRVRASGRSVSGRSSTRGRCSTPTRSATR